MWERLRRWKHAAAPLILGVAYLLLSREPEGSALWFVGLGSALTFALAYILEELAWNIAQGGRPCVRCGHRVRVRSFRVLNTCPGCGQQL